MNKPLKIHILGIILVVFMVVVGVAGINNFLSTSAVSATTTPTYTIFIHGVNFGASTTGYKDFWQQNSANGGIPGYVYDNTPSYNYVCWVEYYGQPWMKCIDPGNHYISLSWGYGYSSSTIAHFAKSVWWLIYHLTEKVGPINLNLVGYSMGGLIAYYMMQTWGESNEHLKNIITLDSPLLGSKAANFIVNNANNAYCNSIALVFTGFSASCASIASEPQVQEMMEGSSFVKNLNSAVWSSPRYCISHAHKWFFAGSADTNPLANKMAAWYIPIDIYLYGSSKNDGIVSKWSETYNYRSTYYTYDAVHTPKIGGSGYSSPSTGTAILQNYYVMQNIAYQITTHQ